MGQDRIRFRLLIGLKVNLKLMSRIEVLILHRNQAQKVAALAEYFN